MEAGRWEDKHQKEKKTKQLSARQQNSGQACSDPLLEKERWTNRHSGKTVHQNDTTLTLHLTGHISANCGKNDHQQLNVGHETLKPAFERFRVWFSLHGERRTELLPNTNFLFQ